MIVTVNHLKTIFKIMNEVLLVALMSQDNSVRRNAEDFYKAQLEGSPVKTIDELISVLSTHNADAVHRSFAAVLLRRAIEKHASAIPQESFARYRTGFITLWFSESNISITRRLAHIIAEIAASSPWEQLIHLIVEHANSLVSQNANSAATLASTLNLVEILAEYCPDDILRNISVLRPFLANFLVSPETSIQIAAARSTCACIISLEDESARDSFKPALAPVINVLGVALSRGNETDATAIMESLVTIAQTEAVFFKGQLDSVVRVLCE